MNIYYDIKELLENKSSNLYPSRNPDFDKLTPEQKEEVLDNKDAKSHIDKTNIVKNSAIGTGIGSTLGGIGTLGAITHHNNTLGSKDSMINLIADTIANHHNAGVLIPTLAGLGLGIHNTLNHSHKAKEIQNNHIDSLLNKNKK